MMSATRILIRTLEILEYAEFGRQVACLRALDCRPIQLRYSSAIRDRGDLPNFKLDISPSAVVIW